MHTNKITQAIALVFAMCSHSAFAQATYNIQGFEQPKTIAAGSQATMPLESLLADNIKSAPNVNAMTEVPLIRAEALQETAVSLGARAGLAKRLSEITLSIDKQRDVYDKHEYDLVGELFGKWRVCYVSGYSPSERPDLFRGYPDGIE